MVDKKTSGNQGTNFQSITKYKVLICNTDLPPLPAIHPQRVVHSDTVECDLDQLEEIGCLGRGAFGGVNLGRCGAICQVLALRGMSKG